MLVGFVVLDVNRFDPAARLEARARDCLANRLAQQHYQANVDRSATLTLRGTDLEGNPIEEHAEGLRAVCIQHEFDHLDGILFIDRISRLKRNLYVKKRKKQLAAEQA